jgi:hypothetical protein
MDNRIAKQMIEFQKTAFDNTFTAMAMFQDQAERTFNSLLESAMWPIPEEGKKALSEWVQAYKKGRDEFKKALDESFKRVEGFFSAEKSPSQQSQQSTGA